ncbi:hypothetical protein Ct61P_11808 [Colletotrichum tofieldiae]|nr:hypothetical protein Ct61P_11808 [Colletotrichum tofieldiae]
MAAYRGARGSIIAAGMALASYPKVLRQFLWPFFTKHERSFVYYKNQMKSIARKTAEECGDSVDESTMKETVPLFHNMVRYTRRDDLEEALDIEIQSQFHATLFFFTCSTVY